MSFKIITLLLLSLCCAFWFRRGRDGVTASIQGISRSCRHFRKPQLLRAIATGEPWGIFIDHLFASTSVSWRIGREGYIISYVSQERSVGNHCANTVRAYSIDPGARWPAFDSRVHDLLAMWPSANSLTSLTLLFTWKVVIKMSPAGRNPWDNRCNVLSPATGLALRQAGRW